MNLQQELFEWLDRQVITSENIGDMRRCCFVPWDSAWNSMVRDETAKRENIKRYQPTPEEEARMAE